MTNIWILRLFLTQYGTTLGILSLTAFDRAQIYSAERGIILADTKLEFGQTENGAYVLADEVLTPDSSRFWLEKDYYAAVARKKSPSGYDKQPVREYGKTVATPFTDTQGGQVIGINNLNPAIPEHREFVGQVTIPTEVIESTRGRYEKVFRMLTDS